MGSTPSNSRHLNISGRTLGTTDGSLDRKGKAGLELGTTGLGGANPEPAAGTLSERDFESLPRQFEVSDSHEFRQRTQRGRAFYWSLEPKRSAIALEPRFWMGRGNLAIGLSSYGRAIHSEYHAAALFFLADKELIRTLVDADTYPEAGYPEARQRFAHEKLWIEKYVDLAAVLKHFPPTKEPTESRMPSGPIAPGAWNIACFSTRSMMR